MTTTTDKLFIDATYNHFIERLPQYFSSGFDMVTPHNSLVFTVYVLKQSDVQQLLINDLTFLIVHVVSMYSYSVMTTAFRIS